MTDKLWDMRGILSEWVICKILCQNEYIVLAISWQNWFKLIYLEKKMCIASTRMCTFDFLHRYWQQINNICAFGKQRLFQIWKATWDNYILFPLFSSMYHLKKKKSRFFIYSPHYVGKYENWRTFESTFTRVTHLIFLPCDIGISRLGYSVTLWKFASLRR